jgi:hypothetical protein
MADACMPEKLYQLAVPLFRHLYFDTIFFARVHRPHDIGMIKPPHRLHHS